MKVFSTTLRKTAIGEENRSFKVSKVYINNSISTQLQDAIEAVESSQQTEKADAAEHDGEDKTEIWPTESDANDDSGEEVLTGVENEVSPTQAKRKIKEKSCKVHSKLEYAKCTRSIDTLVMF